MSQTNLLEFCLLIKSISLFLNSGNNSFKNRININLKILNSPKYHDRC